MSFLDDLRDARQSPLAAFQQFALSYPRTRGDVHAFIEGRDDPSFYMSFLLRVVTDIRKIHVYRCNNKRGVYEAYSATMRLVKGPSFVLFFVDKDHSDLIGETFPNALNIFVTEYYSIENYLVSDDMFRRIWEDFFNLINLQVDYQVIASKFHEELQRFHKFALPLSAWIIFNRRKGLRPNVNNIRLADIYSFDKELTLQTVSMTDLLAHVERVCGIDCPTELSTELPLVIDELASLEPKVHIRGKYELWFFVKFIEKLIIGLKQASEKSGTTFKVRTHLGEENAVEILGPRLQMPQSLNNFLMANGLVST